MNTFRTIWTVALLIIVGFATGCSSRPAQLATLSFEFRHGSNSVVLKSPKDTTFDLLEFDPLSGQIRVKKYTSVVSAEALHAADSQAAGWQALMGQYGQLAAQRFGGGAMDNSFRTNVINILTFTNYITVTNTVP